MYRLLQIFIGYYLALLLVVWPLLLVAVKYIDGSTWSDAQRWCWQRWNEIRRDPYSF